MGGVDQRTCIGSFFIHHCAEGIPTDYGVKSVQELVSDGIAHILHFPSLLATVFLEGHVFIFFPGSLFGRGERAFQPATGG